MNIPIPRPKKSSFTGGTIPATINFGEIDIIFAPAVQVFREYATRLFGKIEHSSAVITLVLQPELCDEYHISIKDTITITASSNIGMNHALSTLLQLAQITDNGVVYPRCEVVDFPDNSWRGVMLDLARCYHEIEYLYAVADLCWFYKLNRFQLHLTDDQAVRFPFSAVPNAVSYEHYTREQLTDLIAYCRDRGITIVPEVDTPGHFQAFNAAYPELFGSVQDSQFEETTAQTGVVSGIMRVQEQTFDLMRDIFKELAEVFYDSPWIHIGGDEASIGQWERCTASMEYCREHGLADAHELYGHCVARISQMILDLGRTPVVWEGFSEKTNHMIPKETLVFAWESYYQTAPSLLKGGFKIINASWKPLYIVSPSPSMMWPTEEILDWDKNRWQHWWKESKAYEKPLVVDKNSDILGGQMCVWGDKMQPTNAYAPRHDMLRDEFANLRMRLPALAQKVWSSYIAPDKEQFMNDMNCLENMYDKLCKK